MHKSGPCDQIDSESFLTLFYTYDEYEDKRSVDNFIIYLRKVHYLIVIY